MKKQGADELTATEIKKISKKFKIPEKDIIDFLAEEDRLLRLSSLRQAYLEGEKTKKQVTALKEWVDNCQTFSEFEEIYVLVGREQLPEDFFFKWINSTKSYKEKREIYSVVSAEKNLAAKLIKVWIDNASNLEDIREAVSHTEKDSEDYKNGIKKIIEFYKR
jgi:hypothetical protein